MNIDKIIRHTKIKGQPHLHLYLSKDEYVNLGKPNKIITNLADFLELKISDEHINYCAKSAFKLGIYYIKLEVEVEI